MQPLIVVALGGNALLNQGETGTIGELERNAETTCLRLLPLLQRRAQLVLTHGNGPQVGCRLLQNEAAKPQVPEMPLDVCVADTEGSIGYFFQQALLNVTRRRGIRRSIVTLITQVLVAKDDPAFKEPRKPIGPFYEEQQAVQLRQQRQWVMAADSGRGWRRLVASPQPRQILQRPMIRRLAREGHIVIALGGGGIPIWKKENGDYEGIEAVIDKDRATSLLAREIGADVLVILTAVPCVYRNFPGPQQEALASLTAQEVRRLIREGHFGRGSMLPKMQSALEFVDAMGRPVLITDASSLSAALAGKGGTWVGVDSSPEWLREERPKRSSTRQTKRDD